MTLGAIRGRFARATCRNLRPGKERTKTEGHSMKNGQRSQPADVN